MTKKEQQAMIARKKAEAEKKKAVNQQVDSTQKSDPETKDKTEQQPEQEEIIITLFTDVDFEIDNCIDQETITDKLIYLANQEKEILSKFKDRELILKNGIYKELYETIVVSFNNYFNILNKRLDLIIRSENLLAKSNQEQFKVGKLKQNKIDNKFQVKMLKYQNWLYYLKKWREYWIERKREKAKYKAEIKILKEQVALEFKKVKSKPKEKQPTQEKKDTDKGVAMSP